MTTSQTREPRVRGNYAKTEQRLSEIMEAAFEVFAANGYAKASIRDVADRAGLSEAGVRHHFPTKTLLLAAVLESRQVGGWPYQTEVEVVGRDRLADFVRQIQDNQDRSDIVELFSVLSAESTDPAHPAHEYFVGRYERVRTYLADGLRHMADTGELMLDVDPRSIARQLIALSDGLQVQWLIQRDFDMAEEVRRYLSPLLRSPL